MWESFFPFFEWHYDSWVGLTVSDSVWLFPAIETIHILAMSIMFGGLLLINLRMLGLGMTQQPVRFLFKTLNPYINWGLVVMLISGYGMFASEAEKTYYNDGFKFKMASLLAVIILQYTLWRWIVTKEEDQRSPAMGAAVGVLNLFLWFCVGAGGRAIGFV